MPAIAWCHQMPAHGRCELRQLLTHLAVMLSGSMGAEALCKALKAAGSSGLKELDLSHTAVDDKAAAALAGLLSSSRVLERLVLTNTSITDAGAQLLCNALQVSMACMRMAIAMMHA